MPVLETERLTLSEFTFSDAPFIVTLLNDPGWLQYIGDRGVRTIPEAENYLQNVYIPMYAKHGFGLWLVRRKNDGAPIGMCGLLNRDTLPGPDIGFAFLPEFGGQGYAFEAAAATVNYAKQTLEMPRLLAITVPKNERSIKLLEKLGFRFEKAIKMADDAEELNLFAVDLL